MSNANVRPRPLSPHLTIYRPQVTSGLSIMNRITGGALLAAGVLVVLWLLGAASGERAFARADGFLTSWLGQIVLVLSVPALWFHFANGIRHLTWDAGYGYEVETVNKTAMFVYVATAVLTVATLLVAYV